MFERIFFPICTTDDASVLYQKAIWPKPPKCHDVTDNAFYLSQSYNSVLYYTQLRSYFRLKTPTRSAITPFSTSLVSQRYLENLEAN
jgi:hypothetical protein